MGQTITLKAGGEPEKTSSPTRKEAEEEEAAGDRGGKHMPRSEVEEVANLQTCRGCQMPKPKSGSKSTNRTCGWKRLRRDGGWREESMRKQESLPH